MDRSVALALLGLSENSNPSNDEINRAYIISVHIDNPDRLTNEPFLQRHAEEHCKRLNEARNVLLDRKNDSCNKDCVQSHDLRKNEVQKGSEAAEHAHGPAYRYGRYGEKIWHNGYKHSRNDPYNAGAYNWSNQATEAQKKASIQNLEPGEQEMPELPALPGWKASAMYSILGLLASIASLYIIRPLVRQLLPIWLLDVPFSLTHLGLIGILVVELLLSIIYAIVVYPSLFTATPRLRSNYAISFCNFFFGGFIFGLLWNDNLTNKKRGISYRVFIVFNLLAAVVCFVMLYSLKASL
jgi:curved DNA-binding protein CbpA